MYFVLHVINACQETISVYYPETTNKTEDNQMESIYGCMVQIPVWIPVWKQVPVQVHISTFFFNHEKSHNGVFEQVIHKPSCKSTEIATDWKVWI